MEASLGGLFRLDGFVGLFPRLFLVVRLVTIVVTLLGMNDGVFGVSVACEVESEVLSVDVGL